MEDDRNEMVRMCISQPGMFIITTGFFDSERRIYAIREDLTRKAQPGGDFVLYLDVKMQRGELWNRVEVGETIKLWMRPAGKRATTASAKRKIERDNWDMQCKCIEVVSLGTVWRRHGAHGKPHPARSVGLIGVTIDESPISLELIMRKLHIEPFDEWA